MSLLVDEPVRKCADRKSLFGHRFTQVKFSGGRWECVWCGKDREENDREVYGEQRDNSFSGYGSHP